MLEDEVKYRDVRAEVFDIIKARRTDEHYYIKDWIFIIMRVGAQA